MSQNHLTREIESRIQRFVAELNTLVRRAAVDSVSAALGTNGAEPRRGPGRPRKTVVPTVDAAAGSAPPIARRRKKGAKRDPKQIVRLASVVKAHVKAHPGEGVETIAKHLGLPSSELKLPIAKLLESKDVRKKGAKRATKYYAA